MSEAARRLEPFLDLLVFGGFALTSLATTTSRQDSTQLALLALAGYVFARRGRGSRLLAILCFLLGWFVGPAAGWLPLAFVWAARAALSRISRRGSDNPRDSASQPGAAPAAAAQPAPPPDPVKPSPDEVERALRETHGESWFTVAISHENTEVRRRALHSLTERGGDADPLLLAQAALTDAEAGLQLDAIAALTRLRSAAATRELLSIVARGRDGNVYWPVLEGAVRALARAGDRSVVPRLVEALDSLDSLAPRELGEALARFGDEAAAELLGALTRPDARQQARAAKARSRVVQKRVRIVEILARMGHQPAGPALLGLINAQEGPLRAAAAQALGTLRHAPAREELVRCLADPDASVRAAAARALGAVGNGETVEQLLRLGEDTSEEVLQAVAEALGRLGDPRALPLLARLFRVSSLRADAAESLLAIGTSGAAEVVRPHLDDRDVPLRVGVLALLQALRAQGFAREARALLARADPDLRAAAAAALGEFGDRAAERELVKRLADADGQVRSFAVRALARIAALDQNALTSAASDPDPRVREAAWDASQSAQAPPREALAAALADPSPAVRAAAASAAPTLDNTRGLVEQAIDRIPQESQAAAFRCLAVDASGAAALVEALPRLDWDARRCAVDALVALGPQAVPAMAGALEHAPALARWWLVKALQRIGDPEAQAALAQAVERDADARVRRRAAASLSAPGAA